MNKSYKIIIYTSDNCSFCHSAKEIFKEKKLKYKEITSLRCVSYEIIIYDNND